MSFLDKVQLIIYRVKVSKKWYDHWNYWLLREVRQVCWFLEEKSTVLFKINQLFEVITLELPKRRASVKSDSGISLNPFMTEAVII